MAEIRESLKIVSQAIENIPAGPLNVGIDERMTLPPKSQVYQTIEGTITHFELVMTNRGFEVPNEEVYCANEAPNGELGFYVVGDGSHGVTFYLSGPGGTGGYGSVFFGANSGKTGGSRTVDNWGWTPTDGTGAS